MKVLGVAFVVFLALSHVEAPALANHRQSIRVAYPSLGLPQAPLWIASAANYFNCNRIDSHKHLGILIHHEVIHDLTLAHRS